MLRPGEVHVWLIRLDKLAEDGLPPASPEEEERAARFATEPLRVRYLRSHRALRAILGGLTGAPLDFAAAEKGKPYLPGAPSLRFNLSHSHGMAMVGAALDVEVGADIEQIRPIRECEAIAERYFPPDAQADFAAAAPDGREREFFRCWTRTEALWKARGLGLYAAGIPAEGDWSVEDVDAGQGFAAAIAAQAPSIQVAVRDFPVSAK